MSLSGFRHTHSIVNNPLHRDENPQSRHCGYIDRRIVQNAKQLRYGRGGVYIEAHWEAGRHCDILGRASGVASIARLNRTPRFAAITARVASHVFGLLFFEKHVRHPQREYKNITSVSNKPAKTLLGTILDIQSCETALQRQNLIFTQIISNTYITPSQPLQSYTQSG